MLRFTVNFKTVNKNKNKKWECVYMKLNQSKEMLIESLELSAKVLSAGIFEQNIEQSKEITILIEKIKALNLPELEGNREYTAKYYKKGKWELIAHDVFWDEELDCWNYKNETVLEVITF